MLGENYLRLLSYHLGCFYNVILLVTILYFVCLGMMEKWSLCTCILEFTVILDILLSTYILIIIVIIFGKLLFFVLHNKDV